MNYNIFNQKVNIVGLLVLIILAKFGYGQNLTFEKYMPDSNLDAYNDYKFCQFQSHIVAISEKEFFDSGKIIISSITDCSDAFMSFNLPKIDSLKTQILFGSLRSITSYDNWIYLCFFGIVLYGEIIQGEIININFIENRSHLDQIAVVNNQVILFECYPRSKKDNECGNTRIQKYSLIDTGFVLMKDTNLCVKGSFYGIRVLNNFTSVNERIFISSVLENKIYMLNDNLLIVDSFTIPSVYWNKISSEDYKTILNGCPLNYPKNCYSVLRSMEGNYSRIYKLYPGRDFLVILYDNPKLKKGLMYLTIIDLAQDSFASSVTRIQRVVPKQKLWFNSKYVTPSLHSSSFSFFLDKDIIIEIRRESFVPKFGIPTLIAKKRYNEYYKNNNAFYSKFFFSNI